MSYALSRNHITMSRPLHRRHVRTIIWTTSTMFKHKQPNCATTPLRRLYQCLFLLLHQPLTQDFLRRTMSRQIGPATSPDKSTTMLRRMRPRVLVAHCAISALRCPPSFGAASRSSETQPASRGALQKTLIGIAELFLVTYSRFGIAILVALRWYTPGTGTWWRCIW
jgi:hypothetical protein